MRGTWDPGSSLKVFEVERILRKRVNLNGVCEYRIRWRGYGEADDTWEPRVNCACPDLIAAFEVESSPQPPWKITVVTLLVLFLFVRAGDAKQAKSAFAENYLAENPPDEGKTFKAADSFQTKGKPRKEASRTSHQLLQSNWDKNSPKARNRLFLVNLHDYNFSCIFQEHRREVSTPEPAKRAAKKTESDQT